MFPLREEQAKQDGPDKTKQGNRKQCTEGRSARTWEGKSDMEGPEAVAPALPASKIEYTGRCPTTGLLCILGSQLCPTRRGAEVACPWAH